MLSLLASLPSPSIGRLSIGPLGLSAYGLMIALGVIAGTALASRRFERAGAGTAEELQSVAMWSVLGGLIGARIYHVVTAWDMFADDLWRIPMVWKGGLGIPGGLLGGIVVDRRNFGPRRPSASAATRQPRRSGPVASTVGSSSMRQRCANDERKEDERCAQHVVANDPSRRIEVHIVHRPQDVPARLSVSARRNVE